MNNDSVRVPTSYQMLQILCSKIYRVAFLRNTIAFLLPDFVPIFPRTNTIRGLVTTVVIFTGTTSYFNMIAFAISVLVASRATSNVSAFFSVITEAFSVTRGPIKISRVSVYFLAVTVFEAEESFLFSLRVPYRCYTTRAFVAIRLSKMRDLRLGW